MVLDFPSKSPTTLRFTVEANFYRLQDNATMLLLQNNRLPVLCCVVFAMSPFLQWSTTWWMVQLAERIKKWGKNLGWENLRLSPPRRQCPAFFYRTVVPVEERMLCASAVLDKYDSTLFLQQIVSTFCTEPNEVCRAGCCQN